MEKIKRIMELANKRYEKAKKEQKAMMNLDLKSIKKEILKELSEAEIEKDEMRRIIKGMSEDEFKFLLVAMWTGRELHQIEDFHVPMEEAKKIFNGYKKSVSSWKKTEWNIEYVVDKLPLGIYLETFFSYFGEKVTA